MISLFICSCNNKQENYVVSVKYAINNDTMIFNDTFPGKPFIFIEERDVYFKNLHTISLHSRSLLGPIKIIDQYKDPDKLEIINFRYEKVGVEDNCKPLKNN